MSLPDWFDDTFIITLVGIIGGGCTYLFIFILKSRCRTVNCGCVHCERDVIALEPSTVSIVSPV